jgi:hypothetical protein
MPEKILHYCGNEQWQVIYRLDDLGRTVCEAKRRNNMEKAVKKIVTLEIKTILTNKQLKAKTLWEAGVKGKPLDIHQVKVQMVHPDR